MVNRILLTGAGGFVGGHMIAAIGQLYPGAVVTRAAFDMRDPAGMRDAVRADKPDACLHLAAISAIGEARADPDLAWQVNLQGTLALARCLMQEAPHCLLLFASTAEAYGGSFRAGIPVDESAPLAPMNTYAATKAAADLALGALVGEGLRVVRLRAFNHTGPGQSAAFVVAAFAGQIARIAAGQQPPVLRVGALDTRRDFLDVRDVCRAYCLCLRHADRLPNGTILNLASGTSRRIGDVLDQLLAVAGVKATIEVDQDRLRPSDIPIAAGDAAAARGLIGWQPDRSWDHTIADVLADWTDRVGRI